MILHTICEFLYHDVLGNAVAGILVAGGGWAVKARIKKSPMPASIDAPLPEKEANASDHPAK